jgi:hypothetical protein
VPYLTLLKLGTILHSITQLKSGELSGCKHLTLSANLATLPVEILNLADSLEILDISNNKLSTLPDWLADLPKLKIIFASNNPFEVLPEVLGQCPQLEMIGFKANNIGFIPENSLPKNLRWLTLTDNQITELPTSLGKCKRLEKLLLAGNNLTALPDNISQLRQLRLLRISANRFESIPEPVLSLPKLAWFAFAGNPFSKAELVESNIPQVTPHSVKLNQQLGQGASGVISKASWMRPQPELPADIAVKKFKGGVTSDGFPADELNAYLKTGHHPNIVESVAHINDGDYLALVMKLIPDNYKNLGLPPSFETCSRDVFTKEVELTIHQIDKVIQQITAVFEHIHQNEVSHGDLYAHNTLIDEDANILFGDFGAASMYHMLTAEQKIKLKAIEYRALQIFIADLLSICIESDKSSDRYQQLLAQVREFVG